MHDQDSLVAARPHRRRKSDEVDVERCADTVLDEHDKAADHMWVVGGAVVDVVVVDLHAPPVVAMVNVVRVCGLGYRQHRDGEDHQKRQPPT